MQQASSVHAEAGIAPPRPRSRRVPQKLHGYFIGFTIVFGAIVLTGFSRTFFLPMAKGTLAKPLVVHIHGGLFFGWTALLIVQAFLAATKRLRLHRRIGSFAAWIIVPMLLMGTIVAARDTVHDYHSGDGNAALSFFYGELADLAMFGVLAGAAMLLRNKPDFHKRWVIMGSLGLLGAAIGRIPEISTFGVYIFAGLIASVGAHDLLSRRALHPATLIGAAFLLAMNLSEEPIGNTQAWLTASHHMLGV
jgi:uncharacterized membrane protein YhhN